MNAVPLGFALICGSIFILVLAAIGIFLIIFTLRSRKKAGESQNWPSATGEIIQSELKESRSMDDDLNESVSYYPAVQYKYEVNGQTLTAKRISFGGILASSNPQKAKAELSSYPVGAQVTVYYNSANPAEAVLVRDAGGFRHGMTIGIICLVLSACVTCPLVIGIIRNLDTL